MKSTHLLILLVLFLNSCQKQKEENTRNFDQKETNTTLSDYEDLTKLFEQWRSFEQPPLKDGAPDYTASSFEARMPQFTELQSTLKSIDTAGWQVSQKVDWMVVWAEMNGYDFNQRVLKPWQRDPAFYKVVWTYKSDVPAHEGPTNHATTELWTYEFPLSDAEKQRLINDLEIIPAFYAQAKMNLTGNARDLWITGIRDIETQVAVLEDLNSKVTEDVELSKTVEAAVDSSLELVNWLKEQSKNKTGYSGIGKDHYTWYLQNVHLVPLTWEDEVMILKRELARAWSSLKLEEHRNRELPELYDASSPAMYDKMANDAVESLISFLDDNQIVTVKPYFEEALDQHKGEFIPQNERNFFTIGEHYDPRPLYSHFYHWFELARMENEPHSSPVRKGPLLYNIFDSRNEGTATAVEEMFMHAGLYDDSPRTREIVYIMIAQRAARGLGSLYAHANEMSMEEAGAIHSEFTPRGWMKTEKELLIFEQHLYLRQPGYGTSYITGKYLLEKTMADYAHFKEKQNEPFVLKEFFDRLNSNGNIPISLVNWQMTGTNDLLPILNLH